MVVDLCLPHFYTTVQCSKLCADGYDVTNLVSADPALRRRGFKLEYFLRPPVEVTLKFGFKVELCRVDVELWPWGMDRGQACKRLEISTNSDQFSSQDIDRGHKHMEQKQKDQTEQNREKRQDNKSKSQESKGHQWSLQARQWGEPTSDEPQQRDFAFKCRSKTELGNPVDFKLVGRCELREETKVSFTRSNFRPRPPFLSHPPLPPAGCRQEELWSRGPLSLSAVTQLRVTVPFGGAASAMGLKALVVWGQPAQGCPAEEVERFKRVHEASLPRPVLFAPSVRQKTTQLQETSPPCNLSIPEEFLDPITQEVMLLPMLLPGGVSVDNTTLEEHQKREATWGRPPNDPFTGVPFTSTSQPLPNPQLKSRIDQFLLQRGMMRRDGMLGGQREGDSPQASRLVAFKEDGQTKSSPSVSDTIIINKPVIQDKDTNRTAQNKESLFVTETKSEFENGKKRDLSEISTESTDKFTAEKKLLPQTKRPRINAMSNCSSHEQRLSASLDEALFSALQGRPSFTSNLSQQRPVSPDPNPQDAGASSVQIGEKRCSACSCSVSVYSQSASSIYRLSCTHLLCGSCLWKGSQPPNSDNSNSTSNHIVCRVCRCLTTRTNIIRVHH